MGDGRCDGEGELGGRKLEVRLELVCEAKCAEAGSAERSCKEEREEGKSTIELTA